MKTCQFNVQNMSYLSKPMNNLDKKNIPWQCNFLLQIQQARKPNSSAFCNECHNLFQIIFYFCWWLYSDNSTKSCKFGLNLLNYLVKCGAEGRCVTRIFISYKIFSNKNVVQQIILSIHISLEINWELEFILLFYCSALWIISL